MIINFLAENEIWNNWFNNGVGDQLSFLYSVFAICGIVATITAAGITMGIRRIPVKEFMHSIYIMVPVALIGGSLFGKLGTNITWYRMFFFWEPGLSIFASLLFGSFAGYMWFNYCKYKNRISVWVYADCIIPHMLLGQAIGRWGNLFNHEILGKEIDITKYQWLPDFIWKRLFYFYDSGTGEKITELTYHQPLFLFESVLNLSFWLIIVFLVPVVFKLLSKKPWKLDPQAFPTRSKPLTFDQITLVPTYVELSYHRKKISNQGDKIKDELLYLTKRKIWMKAYFAFELEEEIAKPLQEKILEHREKRLIAIKRFEDEKTKFKDKLLNKKNQLSKTEFKEFKKKSQSDFSTKTKTWKVEKNWIRNVWTQNCSELTQLNNPYNLTVKRAGVDAAFYLMAYSATRFVLDFFRKDFELTLKNVPILNHLFVAIIFLFATTLFIFAQFIAPNKWREEGWLYEKSY